MLVKNEIKNRTYEKLIEYAFKKSDAVMFITRKDGFSDVDRKKIDENVSCLKSKFGNSLLKSRNGSYWVFTKVGYEQCGFGKRDPLDYDKLFEIFFFKTSMDLKKYILGNKDLYTWLNPEYPEDLSFFKDEYCWLYSVSHEEFCEIYCRDEEEYNYLKSIGVEFVEEQFVSTPKEELYYENY